MAGRTDGRTAVVTAAARMEEPTEENRRTTGRYYSATLELSVETAHFAGANGRSGFVLQQSCDSWYSDVTTANVQGGL
jgi:hypothetical protein